MNRSETAKNLIGKTSLFDDSKEVADQLASMACDSTFASDAYWLKEAAANIEGLFTLAMDLSRALEKTMTEKPAANTTIPADGA